ncbi:hypothetical protein SG34_010735 [Thalassomonas viridans]|uniref:Histidine kinase domain-containing protein n=1 Tax=Thalassomonas viridans TaxID=137584 RepID=A0AAF0CCF0_9GAMM|nr:two-component regulator propeller domain-containing protein [Thalassomonas viridans]WDE07319.1 hypothetical protein SG34_010735 [Thalassomonas viridans]
MKKISYCFLFFWGLSLSLAANENPVFSQLLSQDGLSQDSITAVTQDKYGFIWIGTQEGLNRWDGRKIEQFLNNPGDANSISSDYISDLLDDKAGTLWVATLGGGLNIYDKYRQSFRRFQGFDGQEALELVNVKVLHQSDDGIIWVGTEADGLYLLDMTKQEIRHLSSLDNGNALSSNNIRDIKSDQQGRIWIATENGGVNMWDGENERFVHYRHRQQSRVSLPSDKILSLEPMQDGTVWVGTYDAGLAIINPHQRTVIQHKHQEQNFYSLADNRVRTIFQDSDGRIWVGTDSGLNLWNSDFRGFLRFNHEIASRYSLSDNRVTTIVQDKGGVIWVGTFAGLNKWNARLGSIEHIKKVDKAPSSLSSNIITSITDAPGGVLWIGTWGGGLNHYDTRTKMFKHYMPSDKAGSLSDTRVMSLLMDSQKRLWVGTMRGGLNVKTADQEGFTVYRHDANDPGSISHNGITRLFEDSHSNIWAATFGGGVNLYRQGKFQRFVHDESDENSLGSNRVIGITEGPEGIIWFATDGGGIAYYSLAEQKMRRLALELAETADGNLNSFISILATKDSLWLGSKDQGLLRVALNMQDLSVVNVTHFNRQNDLSSNVIFGILEDDSGMIWLSSNKGLSAMAPETGKIRNFGLNHGLQGNEFNSGAYHKAGDGTLYFGGNNGFNRFNPRHLLLSVNQHQPDIVLTQFNVLNKPKALSQALVDVKAIELDYFENFVSFEFASLDFTQPQKNKFQFRLLGLQEQWSVPSRRNQANYTNLIPGSYTFEVKGSNNAGIWSHPLVIELTVKSPPWRSTGAYLVYSLLVVLFSFLTFYLMKKSANKQVEASFNQKLRMYLYCLDEASDGVAIINLEGNYLYQNQSFKGLLGSEPFPARQGGAGETDMEHSLLSQVKKGAQALSAVLEHGHWQGLCEHFKGHEKVIVDLGLTKVVANEGKSEHIIAVAHDVTEIKHSEDELKRYRDRLEALVHKRTLELEQEITKQQDAEHQLTLSLQEKNVLLKEIHHRVKNNMQVISSLLNMQSIANNNPEFSELLAESQNRIRSMSLIHESLYQSENFLEIDFNDYIHLLAGTLSRVYSSNTYGIDICIDAEDVYLDIDTAVPCGLIINELVSNAYKHAFKGFEGQAVVLIEMKSDDEHYILRVKDNGVGFAEGVDFRKTSSLGMEIVCILTEQIKGTIDLIKGNGSTFVIEFPKKEIEKG